MQKICAMYTDNYKCVCANCNYCIIRQKISVAINSVPNPNVHFILDLGSDLNLNQVHSLLQNIVEEGLIASYKVTPERHKFIVSVFKT